jgi:NADH:ubiquinone oxidoreductase subunit 4 (subunit M)
MLENNPLGWPILSWVVFFPGVGGLIILFFTKKHQGDLIRWLANIFGFLGFAIS